VSPYRFRLFTRSDLPTAERWLHTPEVVRWWGEPTEQFALVAADLDEPQMRQWIVEHKGRPFAYVQVYPTDAWPQPHLASLPRGAVGVDAFIGVPEMVGRGHGSAFLRAFAEMLIVEGASAVAIDPDLDNHRARRAYARAGFIENGVAETDDGAVALMLFSLKIAPVMPTAATPRRPRVC